MLPHRQGVVVLLGSIKCINNLSLLNTAGSHSANAALESLELLLHLLQKAVKVQPATKRLN
jgi:hypothetical protein